MLIDTKEVMDSLKECILAGVCIYTKWVGNPAKDTSQQKQIWK